MRTEKGYRFTLQFPARSIEQQQAGAFLEHLGSKKSSVVVQALTDYLQKYPDLLEFGGTIHLGATASLSKEDVRAIIREELARHTPLQLPETADVLTSSVDQENAISELLDNIGLFG